MFIELQIIARETRNLKGCHQHGDCTARLPSASPEHNSLQVPPANLRKLREHRLREVEIFQRAEEIVNQTTAFRRMKNTPILHRKPGAEEHLAPFVVSKGWAGRLLKGGTIKRRLSGLGTAGLPRRSGRGRRNLCF